MTKMTPTSGAFSIVFLFLAAGFTFVECEFNLVVLHTNDMHSRFQQTNANSGECVKGRGKCYGGFARVKTAVNIYREKAKAKGYSSIFLNAGDTYQGTVYFTIFKWEIVSEMINLLGLDAISLGNHEFDNAPQGLAPFLEHTKVPVVCSNIDYSKEPALSKDANITKLVPSTVLEIDGKKIGIIGYLTPETQYLSSTGLITFENEITAIKKQVTKLKGEGVHILIAVGHAGYPADKRIAEQVPDLDVVVGGHTNTFLYSGKAPDIETVEGPYPTVVKQASGRKVLVVQAYAYTKYLGHLQVTFDDQGEVLRFEGNPILLDESVKQDGEISKTMVKYDVDVKAISNQKIGSSKTFLEGDDKSCRLRECNFGNFVTDSMVHANSKDYLGPGWTNAAIAMIQGGALRTSINVEHTGGDISYAALLTTMPFQNSVERLEIPGTVLLKVLEHSVERYSYEERVGGFMQYSGVHVEYDVTNAPGHRVVKAEIRCSNCTVPHYEPLDTDKMYAILTITFIADGGDGFSMLKRPIKRTVLASTDVDAVQNYLEHMSPIAPELQGRINVIGAAATVSKSIFTYILCIFTLQLSTEYLLAR